MQGYLLTGMMLDHSVSSLKDISSEGTAVAAVQDVL